MINVNTRTASVQIVNVVITAKAVLTANAQRMANAI
jgi:hypothetical protein